MTDGPMLPPAGTPDQGEADRTQMLPPAGTPNQGEADCTQMLEVRGLRAGYGEVDVLRGVDLDVRPGELVALVGANGAGKSTLLKCISGLLPPTAGTIRLGGESIAGAPPARIVRLGVAHVPEGRQVFGRLSVADNLLLGAYGRLRQLTRAESRIRHAEELGIECFRPRDQLDAINFAHPALADRHDLNSDVRK